LISSPIEARTSVRPLSHSPSLLVLCIRRLAIEPPFLRWGLQDTIALMGCRGDCISSSASNFAVGKPEGLSPFLPFSHSFRASPKDERANEPPSVGAPTCDCPVWDAKFGTNFLLWETLKPGHFFVR
jgi:hypothetical protein